MAQAPFLAAPYSLTDPSGVAALNAEITRQAQMIAYINDFYFMVIIIVIALPLILLLRRPSRAVKGPAVAME
jgi:DHA2 family multidrug resistance protein